MKTFSILSSFLSIRPRANDARRWGTVTLLVAMMLVIFAALVMSTAEAAKKKARKKADTKPVVVEELLPLEDLLLPAPKSAVTGTGEFVLRDGLGVSVPRGDRDAEQ